MATRIGSELTAFSRILRPCVDVIFRATEVDAFFFGHGIPVGIVGTCESTTIGGFTAARLRQWPLEETYYGRARTSGILCNSIRRGDSWKPIRNACEGDGYEHLKE